jgi:hypothetical protein
MTLPRITEQYDELTGWLANTQERWSPIEDICVRVCWNRPKGAGGPRWRFVKFFGLISSASPAIAEFICPSLFVTSRHAY